MDPQIRWVQVLELFFHVLPANWPDPGFDRRYVLSDAA
jgi:hypothetical protein